MSIFAKRSSSRRVCFCQFHISTKLRHHHSSNQVFFWLKFILPQTVHAYFVAIISTHQIFNEIIQMMVFSNKIQKLAKEWGKVVVAIATSGYCYCLIYVAASTYLNSSDIFQLFKMFFRIFGDLHFLMWFVIRNFKESIRISCIMFLYTKFSISKTAVCLRLVGPKRSKNKNQTQQQPYCYVQFFVKNSSRSSCSYSFVYCFSYC